MVEADGQQCPVFAPKPRDGLRRILEGRLWNETMRRVQGPRKPFGGRTTLGRGGRWTGKKTTSKQPGGKRRGEKKMQEKKPDDARSITERNNMQIK